MSSTKFEDCKKRTNFVEKKAKAPNVLWDFFPPSFRGCVKTQRAGSFHPVDWWINTKINILYHFSTVFILTSDTHYFCSAVKIFGLYRQSDHISGNELSRQGQSDLSQVIDGLEKSPRPNIHRPVGTEWSCANCRKTCFPTVPTGRLYFVWDPFPHLWKRWAKFTATLTGQHYIGIILMPQLEELMTKLNWFTIFTQPLNCRANFNRP